MKNLILLFCLFFAGNFSLSQEAHSIAFNPRTPDPTLQANLTDCKVNELVVQFNTGNDDLRGRDDNCNVWINIKYGTSQEFLNVNNGARWIDNTSHTVELFLNNPVPLNQLESIKIFTKHCDGISCDNWNLNSLTVKARGDLPDKIIFNHSDNPLFRFTGSEFTTSFSFNIMEKPCGGRTVRAVDRGGNVVRHVPGGNIPNK